MQWDELHVRILHPNTNQLLREHLRQKRGGYRIREEDHPKKMPLSTAQLLRRAELAQAMAVGIYQYEEGWTPITPAIRRTLLDIFANCIFPEGEPIR